MRKLLIVDGSESFTDALREVFKNEFDLHICYDGETALEELLSFQPEILVINLMLPFKDGLTVLQESAHKPKVILAICPYTNTYIEQVAADLGVQYIMLMPTINSLRVRLMDLIATTVLPKSDPTNQVTVHLHILSFQTHLDGYQQLRYGIPIFACNPGIRLSKELYPAIAEHFDLPDSRTVEHSIRTAIESAWRHRNPSVWAKYFPPRSDGSVPCPTNKAFFSCLAQKLEL